MPSLARFVATVYRGRELRGRWGGRRSLPGAGVRPALRFGCARGGSAARRRRAAAGGRGRDRHLAEVTVHEVVELVGAEGLLLDQPGDHHGEEAAVLGQELVRPTAGAVDDLVDLAVDQLGRLLGVVLLLLDLAAKEDELVGLAVLQRAELLAHAVLRDHLAGHLGGLLDVVRRAGRDVAAEVELLSGPAAEGRGDVVLELPLRAEVPVLLRERPGDAHRHAARYDRDLVDRVRV